MIAVLRLGSTGVGVQNWQRFLNAERGNEARENETNASLSLRSAVHGTLVVVDGAFGPKTKAATEAWQRAHGLLADGMVGKNTRTLAQGKGYIPFLPARNYTPSRARTIEVIVIHDMEYPEKPDSAMWCAEFFAGPAAPKASAHYSVDNRAIVQSVADHDVAWHAPGTNANGIGIEHAGYAKQSRDEWLDDYSRSELAVSAALVRRLAATYGIPIQWLGADALKIRGARGITGHRDVSLAFGGTHWDPGPNFPIEVYLDLIRSGEPR